MSTTRRLAGVLLAAASLLALGWLSRAPWDAPGSDAGLLRLSWRMRGERVETCRTRTAAELEALPAHMRTSEECETHLVAYRLIVQVDDAPPDTTRALPGGARGDRPLFVLRDAPLAPGPHRVRIRFEPERPADDAPAPLTLDTVLQAAAGRIELITLDPAARRFVFRP